MSFDSTCRRLAEQFPQDFATWLLDRPIQSTVLNPTELSLEPIRADNIILLEGDTEILHIEWQTDPKDVLPMRLADYRLRLYRKYPNKTIHQVVIYLRPTTSELVYQDYFEIAGMYAEYRVIRIWEVPATRLMQHPGLLPFAALGQTENPAQTLREAVRQMNRLSSPQQQHETMGAAYILSGLVLDQTMIGQIIRRDNMQESVTYQAILQEGREEGRQEGREEGRQEGVTQGRQQQARESAIGLLEAGVDIDVIIRVTGLSPAELDRLQDSSPSDR